MGWSVNTASGLPSSVFDYRGAVRGWMTLRSISVKGLAEHSKVDRHWLSLWLRGKRSFTVPVIERVLKSCNLMESRIQMVGGGSPREVRKDVARLQHHIYVNTSKKLLNS